MVPRSCRRLGPQPSGLLHALMVVTTICFLRKPPLSTKVDNSEFLSYDDNSEKWAFPDLLALASDS
jgi:hypothetical protein